MRKRLEEKNKGGERFLWVASFPPPYSGVEVLAEEIRKVWEKREVNFKLVEISKPRPNRKRGKLELVNLWWGVRDLLKVGASFLFSPRKVYFSTFLGSRVVLWRDFLWVLWGLLWAKEIWVHLHFRSWKEFEGTLFPWERRILHWMMTKIKGVFAPCQFLARELRADFPELKVVFLPNGVDMRFYSPSRFIKKDIDFLFLGNICEAKGAVILFQALKRLSSRQKVRVVLAGENWLGKKLFFWLHLLRRKGVKIKWIGEIKTPSSKRAVIRRSRFLVLPSLGECNPLVVLEALACGVPVITTQEGPVAFWHWSEKEGVLVTPKTPQGLARILVKALRLKEKDYLTL
ncbi:glycosyltransferase family 4 protein, partial [bacterium]|nr:glycosyltransferase family 4 protein [bacterium]